MITSFIKHNSECVWIRATALFPTTRDGWPRGKVCQYASTKADLAAAGLPNQEESRFKLRHALALSQLRHGTSSVELAQWRGLRCAAVHATYRRAQYAPAMLA